MSKGTFIIEHFDGTEKFEVSSAEICAFHEAERLQLIFSVQSKGPAIESSRETAALTAEPDAEFCIVVDKVSWDGLVGQKFEIPESYNFELEEYMTRICYLEHHDVDNCAIGILKNEGQEFFCKITGTCADLFNGEESKPATLLIDAWFTKEEKTPVVVDNSKV